MSAKTKKSKPGATIPIDTIPIDTITIDAGNASKVRGLPAGWAFWPAGSVRGWIFLLASAAILLGVLWWHWNRGWAELESGLQKTGENMDPQARVPANVMQNLLIHRVDPDYPDAARAERMQGVIVLDVIVASDGSVASARAQNGPEILAQAAMNALRWWRFTPYRIDGKPAVVETTLAVEFKP